MEQIKRYSKKTLSVVVPCHNEEESIPLLISELEKIATEIADVNFELIFIDDGSNDNTLSVLRESASKSTQHMIIKYISFSRNFGKEAAMLAGLEHSCGDYVAVMDADLQHPPDMLKQMYSGVVNEGYDCVAARRVSRVGESRIRSWFARRFYKLMNGISSTHIIDGASDYRLMSRQVVDAVLSLREYNRFSKGLFSWVGFSVKWLEYNNIPRVAGKTKWNFWQLVMYSMDGIVAFSIKPLAISSFFGILFCFLSLAGAVFVAVRRIMFGDPVQGWASTVCIILFVGGIQLFSTGILGQYVAKSYMEAKGRPIYIVKEKSMMDECKKHRGDVL